VIAKREGMAGNNGITIPRRAFFESLLKI